MCGSLGGLEHIGSGPYLIASLHEGMADVLCLYQLPLEMRFVARTEIFAWPWVGPLITHLGHVAIDPEKGGIWFRPLLRAARKILDRGESLAIFPQGVQTSRIGKLNQGSGHTSAVLDQHF